MFKNIVKKISNQHVSMSSAFFGNYITGSRQITKVTVDRLLTSVFFSVQHHYDIYI